MPERRPMVLEPLRRTVWDAVPFARAVHAGQVDKSGKPYIEHLNRVADAVRMKLRSVRDGVEIDCDATLQIAWLHDVIEDTGYGPDHLEAEGFSNDVVVAVSDLEKPSWQPYAEYIDYLADEADLPTLLVKIADVEDNSDPARLALLPAETRARLEKKYGAALPVLKAAAERLGWKEISR